MAEATSQESAEQPAGRVDQADLHNQQNRLWAHALYVDGQLVQRANLYIVGQSMLVAAYSVAAVSSVTSSGAPEDAKLRWLALIVAGAGAALALAWLFVNHRQWQYLLHLRVRCLKTLPEYPETWTGRAHRRGPIEPGAVITYVVPITVLVMWGAMVMITHDLLGKNFL